MIVPTPLPRDRAVYPLTTSMLSRFTSTSAFSVYIPPAIYPAGATIEGEVELRFRDLQEENIEEVQLRLRGTSRTYVSCGSILTDYGLRCQI